MRAPGQPLDFQSIEWLSVSHSTMGQNFVRDYGREQNNHQGLTIQGQPLLITPSFEITKGYPLPNETCGAACIHKERAHAGRFVSVRTALRLRSGSYSAAGSSSLAAGASFLRAAMTSFAPANDCISSS